MKIAINTKPLYSGHKSRGTGYYVRNLVDYLKNKEDIEIFEFTNLSEVKNVDLIHFPWFDFYFRTLPIRRPAPTVVTIHDVIPLIFPAQYPVGIKGKANFFLQKLALKSVKCIITDSVVSKRDIQKYLKVEEGKIVVVPLAVDLKFKVLKKTDLVKIQRKYNLPEIFLMFTGDANWTKNLPFLVDSFKKLIQIPEFKDVKLVLVGGVFLKNVENINHPELESLKKLNRLIHEYQLEDRIIRPGHVDDSELVALYNLAAVYVQPSLYEGFGLPVLQAFACGTPVVSSSAGSLPEVGGSAAVYFDPANSNQLVHLLAEVLRDKSLQQKLSKLGQKQIDKFSWEKTATKTVEAYGKAI